MDPPSSPRPPDDGDGLNALPEWHNLPSDCWKLILTKHLPPRHCTIYRLVSKSWKKAIDDLGLHTQSITLHPAALDPTRLPPAMVLQAHTAQVTCVPNLPHMQCILSTVQQMTRLRALTLNAVGALPSLEVFRQVHLPHVTSLTLQLNSNGWEVFETHEQQYPHVLNVQLAQQLPIITGATPNLQSLHVDVSYSNETSRRDCPDWVAAMVAPVPGLTCLRIEHHREREYFYDLSTLADVVPQLQTFVATCTDISTANLLHLCRHPSLTTIEVELHDPLLRHIQEEGENTSNAASGSQARARDTPLKTLRVLQCYPEWLPGIHEIVEPYVSQILVKGPFLMDTSHFFEYCGTLNDPRWQLDQGGAYIDVPETTCSLEEMTNVLPQAALQDCVDSLGLRASLLTIPGLRVLQGYPKLKKLHIGIEHGTDVGDVYIQQICTSLPGFTGTGVSHIGRHLTQLTFLNIYFCSSDDSSPSQAEAWANGFRALPRTLRMLWLRNCGHVVDTQVLEAIVQACPFLEYLLLTYAHPKEEEWTPLIAKLHLLRRLGLSREEAPRDNVQAAAWQQMVHALRHMPGLHSLVIWSPPMSC